MSIEKFLKSLNNSQAQELLPVLEEMTKILKEQFDEPTPDEKQSPPAAQKSLSPDTPPLQVKKPYLASFTFSPNSQGDNNK